jgi:hypothetical protein
MKTFPLPPNLHQEDYWVLRPIGIEWHYVLTKILETYIAPIDASKFPVFIVMDEMEQATYYLIRKEFLAVDILSHKTGIIPEKLLDSDVINLTVKPRPDLPLPTVSGWGEA